MNRNLERILMAFGATTPYLYWRVWNSMPEKCAYHYTWFCGFLYSETVIIESVVIAVSLLVFATLVTWVKRK